MKKKWIIGTITIIIFLNVIGSIWFNYSVKKGNGSYTKVLNAKPYFKDYTSVGIKNVNILHPDCSHFILNQNVILKNGLIHSIDSTESLDPTIKYIDGTGKFLIPGLVDTHVHLSNSKNDLLLFLANGVTSVWEMLGNQRHLEWKKEQQEGAISPNIFVSTGKFGSKQGFFYNLGAKKYGQLNYNSTESARNAVVQFKKEGFDAIKLGSFLNQTIYNSILNEAKKQKIPVLGHLPLEVGLNNVYESGQSQLAHIEEITKNMMNDFGGLEYDNTIQFLKYLNKNCDSVALKLKEKQIAVSTTIWLMESLPKQKFDLDNFIKTIELKYANPGIIEGTNFRKGWLPRNNHYENLDIKSDSIIRKKSERYWKTYVDAIHIMTESLSKNGVTILAGTDANTASVISGYSLHNELESLVNSGLTNKEVLYSATVAPAEWSNKNTGKIKIGKKADLILLTFNPLEDITNTKSIEYVFFNNHFIDKNQISNVLNEIENINDENRNIDISRYID